MRITFVGLGLEQLGVSLLSAIAKKEGHIVNLAFSVSLFNDRYNFSIPFLASLFDDRRLVLEAIKKQKSDVLAFSPLTGTYQWMLGIAKEAKMLFPHVKVIFGGVHSSAVPERVLAQPQVDYVCVGEGDISFPLILRAIEKKEYFQPIPNTRYKSPNGCIIKGPQNGFIQDLDVLPFFDKTLWEDYIRLGDIYYTMGSRGCPYRCTFCFNNFFAKLPDKDSGKYVRHRSVHHMMNELRWAKKRYKLRFVEFEDDVFTVNKKWVKDLLGLYKKEIGIPFQCLTHPKYMDEEVGRWLSQAGCQFIQLGIQSMDDQYKHGTIKRYEKSFHVEKALEVMRKFNLKPKVDHMFGLPGEPLEAQETARKLYVKYPPYRIQTFWTKFLPGTEMVEQGLKMGLITKEDIQRFNDGLDFDFYRMSGKYIDPKRLKIYMSYEVLFKLIPVLPSSLLKNISPQFFQRLPVFICSLISFLADVLGGLVKSNPDHTSYARHHLYHFFRFFLNKLGIKSPPAIRPRAEESRQIFKTPQTSPQEELLLPIN